ncbi:MAG: NBR1-Ig-like domain-containing protein [bacterium]
MFRINIYYLTLILVLILLPFPVTANDMTFGHPASTYQIEDCLYNTLTCANNTEYHTGIDYSGNGTHDIVASNEGTIVYVEYMSSNDHGMGNNIIIEHILLGNKKIYSLYAHLKSIEVGIAIGNKVYKGEKIGVMGGSGYGKQDNWDVHLHFEIKDASVTDNPSGTGLYWGYTPSNPDNYGYHNPNDYIGKISISPIDKFLTYISSDTINVYWIQNNKKYRVINPDVLNTMQNAGIHGWSWTNVYTVSNSYAPGPDFISSDSTSNGIYIRLYEGTDVYLINKGKKEYVSYSECQQANCWDDIIDVPQVYLDMFSEDSSDITDPIASTFSVNPGSLTLGNAFTISYTASDTGGSGLNRVELWRANDSNGSPGNWSQIISKSHSGNGPSSATFTNAPPSVGIYWYGIHVVDNAGNWSCQPDPPGPSKVIVCSAPDTPSNPLPCHMCYDIIIDSDLDWSDSANADSYDVYFGTSSNPPYYGNTTSSSYSLPPFDYNTLYYWKIVAKNNCGNNIPSNVWSFSTASEETTTPHANIYDPSPADDHTTLLPYTDENYDNQIPLILIHGIHGNRTAESGVIKIDDINNPNFLYWQNFIDFFYKNDLYKNYKLYLFFYESDRNTVWDIAKSLRNKIDDAIDCYAERNSVYELKIKDVPFVIVAHSMGGLVARSYMNEHSHNTGDYKGNPYPRAGDRIIKLITLATPHHGTPAANDAARTNFLLLNRSELELIAITAIIDIFYWWQIDTECTDSILQTCMNQDLLSAFRNFYSVSQNCQVRVYEPNRSDLRFDNYCNISPKYNMENEKNSWMKNLNDCEAYSDKIIAYYGYINSNAPYYRYLISLSPLELLTVFAYSYMNKIIPADYNPSGVDLIFDEHKQLLFSSSVMQKFYYINNDGFVPVDSAKFYGSSTMLRRSFEGYDHADMKDGKLLNGSIPLFETIKADLLNILDTLTLDEPIESPLFDNAQFVPPDITIPDGTELLPGQSFTKTWRIKNTGTTTWESGYKWVFVSGSKMQGPNSVTVSGVEPGGTIDVNVDLVAPNAAGIYKGNWRMQNSSGAYFGDQCWVEISVKQNALVVNPNLPSAQLSVIYNQDEDKFYLSYSVNEYTDRFKIYYSLDNGSSWINIFEQTNIDPRKGNQPVNIDEAKNYNRIEFRIEAANTSNNETYTSDIITLYYMPKKPHVEKSTEIPQAPCLYGLGITATRDRITLRWRKVIDSHHNDNVNYYEIEYADNSNFSNAIRINAGNPAPGDNMYESIHYTITNLKDNTTYYFRVRAINNRGTGPWSNSQSIRIDIQDFPYFDESYQEPGDGATGVGKSPILRWRAYDEDGDDLDYFVTYGTDQNNLNYFVLRSFLSDHKGQNWFDFAEEYHEPLKPNTTYYWQIWVREDGNNNKDYYSGEYIKSPIWHFTTVATGSDLAITKVEHEGEIKPDSTVGFQLTVKNLGSETAKLRSITCSYIKNGSESPFWLSWGHTSKELAPAEEEVVDVTVQFRDRVWESNGKIYDNVLVSEESQIKFYFSYEDAQDVDTANNEYTYTINYIDAGGPVVTHFNLREYGSMYDGTGIFWARMGQELTIVIEAYDDIRVARGIIDLRYDSTTDDWILLYDGTNDYDYIQFYSGSCPNCTNTGGNFIDWLIPTEIQPTNNAQIRVRLYDDKGNETIKTSELFSIYSNRIDADILPTLPAFTVGQDLTFSILNDSDNEIRHIEVKLLHGSSSELIYSEENDNGIVFLSQYNWEIPDKNYYSSQNCYLELIITDIRGNARKVRSDRFRINADTELPSPFNKAIILYDEEIDFPIDAMYKEEYQQIKFVKMDETNIVHAVVEHMYRYYLDTAVGDNEDTFVYENNKYYITYDKLSDTISSKTKICDKKYEVVDLEIFQGTPYALLKSPGGTEKYYYTYKSGSSFVSPIIIKNENVPRIAGTAKIDDLQDRYFCDPTKHILVNGYLWDLCVGWDKISRYSFSEGHIGSRESITIQNNAGDIESFWIKPTSDGTLIYFINPWELKLVKFDTESLIADSYQLPFTIGMESNEAIKTSLVAKSGKVFIFGNGKVYSLEGENIVEKAHIAYTFDGQTVDFVDNWDWINFSRVIKTENRVYLIFDNPFQSKPIWTPNEILEFDTGSCTFSKNIARTSLNEYIDNASDIAYIGNNKALVVFTDNTIFNSINIYSAYLKMLDLETGNIFRIGDALPFKAEEYIALIHDGSCLYAMADNTANYSGESYRLTIDNFEKSPNQIDQIQFIKNNEDLYAAWGGGHPYDGTWNYEEGRLKNYGLDKNKFIQIFPTLGSITNFSDEDFGTCLNIVDDYLSSTYGYGKIYSLNSDLTIKQALYDGGDGYTPLEFKSFGSTFIAALNMYNNGKMNFILFKKDLSIETFDSLTQSNELAAFDDEAIFVGYGYEPYRGKNVVTKLDLTKGEKSIIAFGSANSLENYKKVDINQNKYVAVAWGNFLAVGNLSGDIVQPEVIFTNAGAQVTDGTTLMLSWQASDNRDELIKYEIYKIVEGANTLIDTITDVSITNDMYTLSEGITGEITFKIIAYDYEGNINYDTVTFDIIEPLEFTSFSVNKSTAQLGEKLIFTWSANGTNSHTGYTVCKKKAGSSEWQEYFKTDGETNKIVIVEGYIGEYTFKIEAGQDSMELSHAVVIEGEMVEFDYSKFFPDDTGYYVDQRIVDFAWGIGNDLSESVNYELYLKKNGEENFSSVAVTFDTSYQYLFRDEVTDFDWKVTAYYHGMKYESKEFHIQLKEIVSPDVTSLNLINNDTDTPSVKVQFNTIEGIDKYIVTRKNSAGIYETLDIINVDSFVDDTVEYGEFYEYAILSKAGDLIGEAGTSQKIFIQVKEIDEITIQNENHAFLDKNEITINIIPDSDNCYEKYEVVVGESQNLKNLFTITEERSIPLSNLAYNTTYYIDIYPLDYKNERVTNLPASLVFATPFEPVPASPSNLIATSSEPEKINVSWTDNSNNETGFKIERKTGESDSWSQLFVMGSDVSSYIDMGLNPGITYFYRVRAYNASGNSGYSNETQATSVSETDDDGDGYFVSDGDCDNNNSSIYPGAIELCNNIDDNCNGQKDENLSQSCYTGPFKTEGVGICKGGTQICNAGMWETCTGEILPSLEEYDGLDNDCDGEIDEVELIDDEPPVAVIMNTPGGIINTTQYSVSIGGIDVISYRSKVDYQDWSDEIDVKDSFAFTLTSEGDHTLYILGKDSAGNWQKEENATVISWKIDRTPPVALVSHYPEGRVGSTEINIKVAGTDVQYYKYKLDDNNWSAAFSAAKPIRETDLAEGAHSIDVIGLDTAGNWQEEAESTTIIWAIDTTIPTAVLDNLPESITNKIYATISVNGVNIDKYKYTINNATIWNLQSIEETIDLTKDMLIEGQNILYVNAYSPYNDIWQDGPVSEGFIGETIDNATKYNWTLDLTPPEGITTLNAEYGAPPSTAIELSWQVVENGLKGYQIWYSEQDIKEENLNNAINLFCDKIPGPAGYTEAFLTRGLLPDTRYYFGVKSIDEAGNFSNISNIATLMTSNILPQILTVELAEGGRTGDNSRERELVISGENFIIGKNNKILFISSTDLFMLTFEIISTSANETKIIVDVPIGAPTGAYNLRVININGTSELSEQLYTITDPSHSVPEVNKITPDVSFPQIINIELEGKNFTGATAITFVTIDQEVVYSKDIGSPTNDTTILAPVDLSNLTEGFYYIQVHTPHGFNSISSAQFEISNILDLNNVTGTATTTRSINMPDNGIVPVHVTLTTPGFESDNPVIVNKAKIKVDIDPGTAILYAADGLDNVPYTGIVDPPRQIPVTPELVEELGSNAILFSMGSSSHKLIFGEEQAIFVRIDITMPDSTSDPSIYYIEPDGNISLAGIEGIRFEKMIKKGGAILSRQIGIPETGLTSYTFGLLLDHMSIFAVGIESQNLAQTDSNQEEDNSGEESNQSGSIEDDLIDTPDNNLPPTPLLNDSSSDEKGNCFFNALNH